MLRLGVSRGGGGGGGAWCPKYLINQNTYYYGQNVTKYLKRSEAVYLIPKIGHNIEVNIQYTRIKYPLDPVYPKPHGRPKRLGK
jgi:hypothetical protein